MALSGFSEETQPEPPSPPLSSPLSLLPSGVGEDVCPQWNSSWSFLHCPEEDECANGHHHCNSTQDCHDQPQGYNCTCRQGYVLSRYKPPQPLGVRVTVRVDNTALSPSVSGQCEPVCSQGCVNGTCVSPGVCRCHFGFVGDSCSAQCRCNKHSDCASLTQPDVCLECHNNTMVSSMPYPHQAEPG